jgi:mono/diheme cytochrome c family protein
MKERIAMRFLLLILAGVTSFALCLCGCRNAPGRPGPGERPVVPGEVSDFSTLFGQNCAGCHGAEGRGGAAIALANPVYLAVSDDAILHRATASGIPGTSMPAFAQSAGGMLTDKQIDVIVGGIRERWSKTDLFQGADRPPYSPSVPGDPTRGSKVYAIYCSSCHGDGGRGGQKARGALNWVLRTGEVTFLGNRCRHRKFPMSWLGSHPNGRNFPASHFQQLRNGSEKFDEFTRGSQPA